MYHGATAIYAASRQEIAGTGPTARAHCPGVLALQATYS